MKLKIVTPAGKGSFSGNYTTAARLSWLFKGTPIKATASDSYDGENVDALLAIHAVKSHSAIKSFRRLYPERPVVLLLAGTDIYRTPLEPRCLESLQMADRLVVLQHLAIARLPQSAQEKTRTIYQSACAPAKPAQPLQDSFEVAVVANLRPVKDPLRTAMALRTIPTGCRILVTHCGTSLSDSLAQRARDEYEISNHKYRWVGGRPAHQALQLIQRARLMVNSSKSEGGANVISEAVVCGTPILASRIDGNVGLLGKDYPGYFEVGDTHTLGELIFRSAEDSHWRALLTQYIEELKPRFDKDTEREAWLDLFAEFSSDTDVS